MPSEREREQMLDEARHNPYPAARGVRNYLAGENGLQFLADLFGIDTRNLSGLTIEASIDSVVSVLPRYIAEPRSKLDPLKLEQGARRYMVTIEEDPPASCEWRTIKARPGYTVDYCQRCSADLTRHPKDSPERIAEKRRDACKRRKPEICPECGETGRHREDCPEIEA